MKSVVKWTICAIVATLLWVPAYVVVSAYPTPSIVVLATVSAGLIVSMWRNP